MKNKINKTFDSFNLELTNNQIRILLITVVILVITLLFRKIFHTNIERIIVFMIIFLLFLVISKNLVITIIGTCIIFLFLNLIMSYKNVIEDFDNTSSTVDIPKSSVDINSEPSLDMGIFQTDEFKKSSEGIQELLKKVNGGIELKDDDLKETKPIGIDLTKYKDDEKPNPLKLAQKESYELIDTVNALKDTISTLSPVLSEGKKLMSLFENLKF
jgi:hypothetical protein